MPLALGLGLGLAVGGSQRAATDPYFSSVVALVGMSGTNGSTTFTDESSYARTLTTNGNAQVSSAQTLFGNNTGLFDGTGDYISAADNSLLSIANTTDKTIESWVRITTGARNNTIVNKRPATSAHEFSFYVDGTNKLTFAAFNAGATSVAVVGTTALSTGVWYHVAAVRSTGGVWKIFVDGTQDGTGTEASTPSTTSSALLIGRDGSTAIRDFAGHIAEVRYTNVARYSSNFARPTTKFPRS